MWGEKKSPVSIEWCMLRAASSRQSSTWNRAEELHNMEVSSSRRDFSRLWWHVKAMMLYRCRHVKIPTHSQFYEIQPVPTLRLQITQEGQLVSPNNSQPAQLDGLAQLELNRKKQWCLYLLVPLPCSPQALRHRLNVLSKLKRTHKTSIPPQPLYQIQRKA